MQVGEQVIPKCGPEEVIVKVHAASLNPVDYKVRNGSFNALLTLRMPVIMGFDFSGDIVEVGGRVQAHGQWKVGQEVFGNCCGLKVGSVAEYMAVDAKALALKPNNISHVEAASVPLCGETSLQAFDQ